LGGGQTEGATSGNKGGRKSLRRKTENPTQPEILKATKVTERQGVGGKRKKRKKPEGYVEMAFLHLFWGKGKWVLGGAAQRVRVFIRPFGVFYDLARQ